MWMFGGCSSIGQSIGLWFRGLPVRVRSTTPVKNDGFWVPFSLEIFVKLFTTAMFLHASSLTFGQEVRIQCNEHGTVGTQETGSYKATENLYVILSDDTKNIDANAFKGWRNLKSLTYGGKSSITIGIDAFAQCSELKTIAVSSIASIGSGAFDGCEKLRNIDVSKTERMGRQAFRGCRALKNIKVFENCTFKGDTFKGCLPMTVVLADANGAEVRKIENFHPKNIYDDRDLKFSDFVSYESYIRMRLPQKNAPGISERYLKAYMEVFSYTGKYVKNSAFFGYKELREVFLPNAEHIGSKVFGGCWSLKNITVFENCTFKGDTFLNAPSITVTLVDYKGEEIRKIENFQPKNLQEEQNFKFSDF